MLISLRIQFAVMDIGDPDPDIGYDYTTGEWQWWSEPKNSGKGIWTDPYYDEGAGNIVMTTYSVPFYRDGKFQGVATVDVALETLFQELGINTRDDRIITKEGRYVFHPEHEFILNHTVFTLAEKYKRNDLYDLGQKIIDGYHGVTKVRDWKSNEYLWIFSSPIKAPNWFYLSILPENTALDFIQKQWQTIGLMLSVTLLMVMIIIWYASGLISRPVKDLHQAAKKVSDGDFDIWVKRK